MALKKIVGLQMHMIIKMAQEKNSDGGGSGPLNPLEPFG